MVIAKKVFIVVLALFVMITMFSPIVNADDVVGGSGEPVGVKSTGGAPNSNFDFTAFDTPPEKGVNETNKIVNQTAASVIGIARIVCVTIAIVMLLVIAMKYMISAPGDRADIKKHAVNYVIGAFVLFGITGILTILNNFAQSIGG